MAKKTHDVRVSVGVKQAVQNFVNSDAGFYDGVDSGYNQLTVQLERVRVFYEKERIEK